MGGYLYDRLEVFINEELTEFRDRIKLVFNPKYSTFGSGYSLILGIQDSDPNTDEVVFVEGDLYFDRSDFERIKESTKNVFTVNHDLITARKAVVVYESEDGFLRYLYDTSHSYLRIREPFLAVYNSGQVWKFKDIGKLIRVVNELSPEQTKGTNLEIIQGYFGDLEPDGYEMVEFSVWHNCNTVNDYETVYSKIKE